MHQTDAYTRFKVDFNNKVSVGRSATRSGGYVEQLKAPFHYT